MSGAIEKLISESEVVAHLYAVAGSVGEMIDAARAELAALRAENSDGHKAVRHLLALVAPQCEELPTTGGVVSQLDNHITGLRAENARLKEVQDRDRACLFGVYKENARYREAINDALHELRLVPTPGNAAGRAQMALEEALSGAPHEAEGVSSPGIWLSLEQLREIEWAATKEGDWDSCYGDVKACPVCFKSEGDSHAPDCWLAEKLAKAEAGHNVTGEDEIIEDGFGNAWSAKCPACGGRIEVVRPGKVQCENCG